MECSRCKTTNNQSFYKSRSNINRNKDLCKKCTKQYLLERRIFLKKKCVEYKGGKCEKCGYNRNYSALDFHHIKGKDEEIGRMLGRAESWDIIRKELDKCILICATCHREIHNPNFNSETEFSFSFDIEGFRKNKKRKGFYKGLKTECKGCGKEFEQTKRNKKYCSLECLHKFSRKVSDRPSEKELAELIDNNSWCAIGRMFGISDNAVRRWAKGYGLI